MGGKYMEQSGMALFIDIENAIGHCAKLGLPFQVRPVCEVLKEIAPLRMRKAFGDIPSAMRSVNNMQGIAQMRRDLAVNIIEITDVPYIGYKNSADVTIVASALALAYENPHISHFAFVANDKDYVPLYSKLKSMGKYVVVISIDENEPPPLLVESADHLIYYEYLPRIAGRMKAASPLIDHEAKSGAATDGAADEDLLKEYAELAMRSAKAVLEEGKRVYAADMYARMKQLRSDADLSRPGFESIGDFLQALAAKGYARILHDETGAVYIEPLDIYKKDSAGGAEPIGADLDIDALCKLYKESIERTQSAPLGTYAERETILNAIKDTFEVDISLMDWAMEAHAHIMAHAQDLFRNAQNSESMVIKILLSLYFQRCFYVILNQERKNNPIITGIAVDMERFMDVLSRQYISNIRLKTEYKLNPEAFAKLLYEQRAPEMLEKCATLVDEVINLRLRKSTL